MKKVLSILAMLILISSVVLAGKDPNPSESSNMAIVKCGDVVKVFYKKTNAEKVRVTIYNDEDQAVFSEELKSQSGFVRPYNLASLPEGEYRVVMQGESEKREESVSNMKEYARPLAGVIKPNANQLVVTLFSKEGKDLNVTLLDDQQNVLFSEKYTVEGQASKLFNLRKVKGAVSVEVSDEAGIIKSTTL